MFKSAAGEEKNVFPFPLFTTCVHMVVQFALAGLVLYLVPRFRPTSASKAYNHDPYSREEQPVRDPSEPVMTRWFYLTRIGPCGAATGLDIGLGNMSFKFITLTFYSKTLVLALTCTRMLIPLQPCASHPFLDLFFCLHSSSGWKGLPGSSLESSP